MKKETEQKLATALGQALEEDFKTIPEEEELKKRHRFSKKHEKAIRRIEEGKKPETSKLLWWNRHAKVLVAGLAVIIVLGVASQLGILMPKMGNKEMAMDSATAVTEECAEDADDAVEESEEAYEQEAGTEAGGSESENADGLSPDEKAAPWDGQLTKESMEAYELASWRKAMLDDEMLELESENLTTEDITVSEVYEVYMMMNDGQWMLMYQKEHPTSTSYAAGCGWGYGYSRQKLCITEIGTYRLVRYVEDKRQVLELHVDQIS